MKNRLVASFICFLFLTLCIGTGFAFDNFIGAGQWDHVAMTYTTSSSLDDNHNGKQTVDGESDTLYLNYYHDNDATGWGMWVSAFGGGGGVGNPSPTGFTGPAWIAYDFGQSYPVKEMLVWNLNQNGATNRSLKAVTIKISTNGTTWTTVFNGNLTQGTGVGLTRDPVTTRPTGGGMPPTNTIAINQDVQYVVIDASSTYNVFSPDFYGLSEVRWNLLNPKASTPVPANEAINVATNAALKWQAGEYATGHQVYFGTNYYHVLDATPSNPLGVYKGTQASGYSPGPLAMDRTYYWRVDATDGTNVWKGDVWSFSTVNNVVIDSFDADVTSRWYPFGTGAVSQSLASCAGPGAILLTYNNHNSPYFSAAERYYYSPNFLNLAANNVKSMSLTFRGATTNGTSNAVLFVELKDSASRVARVQHTDPNAVLERTCTEWNIDLAVFKTAPNPTDFDLANVSQIRLGVGSGQQAASPTTGEVLFDSLVVYQERCIDRPAGDLTNDCVVNIDDLEVFLRFWLDDNRFPQ